MNKIIVLVLFIMVSCATSRIDRKINDGTWDSLADESYLRWDEARLKKSSDHEVVACYQGEAKETLERYKKGFMAQGQSPYYWLHVGNCYFVEEEWMKAEFFYRMGLADAKTQKIKSIALNNLGLIHFKYEQWEKGKDFLREAMALSPGFKVPSYNMSQLYLQFGHYDRAIEVLNGPAFRGHKDIDVYFSLANAHLYKGDVARAGEYFMMIPDEHFRREDIATTYALYLLKTGKITLAREVMNKRARSEVPELTAISQKIEKMLNSRTREE